MKYTYSKEVENEIVNPSIETLYKRSDGAGNITGEINEPLLNTQEACNERAEAEFLEKSYQNNSIIIETFFRDSIELAQILENNGTQYKIIEQNINGSGATISTEIKAKRWD
jgi:hypothetical protein